MGYTRCPDGHRGVVCLCGSTRFKRHFEIVQKYLTLQGKIVLSVGMFGHSGDLLPEQCREGNPTKDMLDALHLKKINFAEEVYVIDPDGYIGSSTTREIEHAIRTRKRVSYLSMDPEMLANVNGENLAWVPGYRRTDGKFVYGHWKEEH